MNPRLGAVSVLVNLLALSNHAGQVVSPSSNGLYFGQKPPGATPIVFAPGIVSLEGRHEFACGFAPDGKAFLFTAQEPQMTSTLMICELQGEAWTSPRKLRLGDSAPGEMEGFFAPDGKSVHFVAPEGAGCAIWKATKQGSTWGKARKLAPAVNTGIVFYPSLTADGTLYFTDVKKRQVCKSVPAGGEHVGSEPAGLEFGGHAFVTRDDRTIVLDSRGDLYASFRLKNGSWSKPRKLGPAINTPEYRETCPSLSPDGRFLFFSRYDEKGEIANLYWVSSTEIDTFRSQVEDEEASTTSSPSSAVPGRPRGKLNPAQPGSARSTAEPLVEFHEGY